MSKKGTILKVKSIAEPIAEKLNYELVDVEFVKENSDYFLRIYIYKEGGTTLDDCQQMSQIISEKLDEEDFIDVSYYLEVSSPGLDRPLKTDKDLERNLGTELDIRLYKAIDGRRNIEGILESYDDNELIVRIDSDVVLNIPREIISLIKLVVKF